MVEKMKLDQFVTANSKREVRYLHAEHLASRFCDAVFERELVFPDDCPAVFVSSVRNHVEIRSPHLEFSLPVDDGGQRGAH